MSRYRLNTREVLERLHAIRQILAAVNELLRTGPGPGPSLSEASALFESIETLEQAARTIPIARPEIAAYAADVEAFARHILGELLAAAPAGSDGRRS